MSPTATMRHPTGHSSARVRIPRAPSAPGHVPPPTQPQTQWLPVLTGHRWNPHFDLEGPLSPCLPPAPSLPFWSQHPAFTPSNSPCASASESAPTAPLARNVCHSPTPVCPPLLATGVVPSLSSEQKSLPQVTLSDPLRPSQEPDSAPHPPCPPSQSSPTQSMWSVPTH